MTEKVKQAAFDAMTQLIRNSQSTLDTKDIVDGIADAIVRAHPTEAQRFMDAFTASCLRIDAGLVRSCQDARFDASLKFMAMVSDWRDHNNFPYI